jgi:hypothetical protein
MTLILPPKKGNEGVAFQRGITSYIYARRHPVELSRVLPEIRARTTRVYPKLKKRQTVFGSFCEMIGDAYGEDSDVSREANQILRLTNQEINDLLRSQYDRRERRCRLEIHT